jgi:sulfite exporter TauE/SafE
MTELLAPFMLGLLGSGHCLGMCGPLVLAYSLQERDPAAISTVPGLSAVGRSFSHHLAFQAGRLLTYGLLGGLAAGLFQFASLYPLFHGVRGGVTVAGGCLMVLLGLILLRLVPIPGFLGTDRLLPDFIRVRMPVLLQSRRFGAKMVLGLLAGFMPCGLSWGMLVVAMVTQNVSEGFFIMISFGLGTLPALFSIGLFSSVLSVKWRLAGERLAACGVLAMGILMVVKGSGAFLL